MRVRPHGRQSAAGALLAVALLVSAGASGQTGDLPTTPDELIATVTRALAQRDMAAFDALVNWKDARPFRRRFVSHQISTGFGRPVRSITLEPFPADGLAEAEERGTLRANMPVSHRLRVVFDEAPGETGEPPTSVFLIGKDGDAYRIALIVPVPKKDD